MKSIRKLIHHNYIWCTPLFFLLFGCNLFNGPLQVGETDGRVVGSINGVVTDANTHERLEGIEVSYCNDGKVQTTITDSLGYYTFTDLHPGDYEITFSGNENYAISLINVAIPTLQQVGIDDVPTDEDFYHSESRNMPLYALNSGLTGVLYTKEDNEKTVLADDVTIIAKFRGYDISPDEYWAVSDSIGIFTFENLPAIPSVELRTMPYNDGSLNYSVKTISATLVPNAVSDAGNIILSVAPSLPFVVENNFENNDFELMDNLIITFSKAMEASSFTISLSGNLYGDVSFEESWSDDVTLVINPYVPLQANETYYLSLFGESQDNNAYAENFTFNTIEGIQFVRSNLERVNGVYDQFPISYNIELIFDMEVDISNYNGYVHLYDGNYDLVASSVSLSEDGKTVIINPRYDLEYGQDYYVQYKVYSTLEGDFNTRTIAFTTVRDLAEPSQVTGFAVDQGSGWKADWNTTSIIFKWNTVENADGYGIYAKYNDDQSDLVRIRSISAQDHLTEQSGTVYLNSYSQFDYYSYDGLQTPFSGGRDIAFQIVAYNDAGESDLSDAVIVQDQTPPTGTLTQSGTADNSGNATAKTLNVNFSTSEYMSATQPTFGFVENGGDPSYVLLSSAASFNWNENMKGGIFTITVPANTNGAGDTFYVAGFKDNSGNSVESSITITLY